MSTWGSRAISRIRNLQNCQGSEHLYCLSFTYNIESIIIIMSNIFSAVVVLKLQISVYMLCYLPWVA